MPIEVVCADSAVFFRSAYTGESIGIIWRCGFESVQYEDSSLDSSLICFESICVTVPRILLLVIRFLF